jgi:hypothetical protein
MFRSQLNQALRRGYLCLAALVGLALGAPGSADPLLLRHKLATITTPNLRQLARQYDRWLDYKLRERGRVSAALAASWGTPKAAGRPYVLMSSDAAPDVFIRAIQAPAVPGSAYTLYAPMRSYGWNAIELIVDNPDSLREKLRTSPFTVIGEPAALNGYPTIRAFQLRGPSDEVLYLTAETGDRSKSILPAPNGPVGRVFIMVLAGPDIDALQSWYSDHFNMTRNAVRQRPVAQARRRAARRRVICLLASRWPASACKAWTNCIWSSFARQQFRPARLTADVALPPCAVLQANS